MTSIMQAKEAIAKVWADNWSTPFQFENESFTPPQTAWARLVVRHSVSAQETLGGTGNRRFERTGSTLIQIFTPTNQGTAEGETLAVQARELFEGKTLVDHPVHFGAVTISEDGVTPDGEWMQHTVSAPFRYEEQK